jgi:hypothetical protein
MQFTGKLTESDLSDVRRLLRTRTYWPKILFANWYGLALVLILFWVTISSLFGRTTTTNWKAIGIMWLILGGIATWVVYNTKRSMAREFAQLNAALPDYLNLTLEGVKIDGPHGTSALLPWRSFKGWREGKQVFLLDQLEGNSVVILPVAQLSETDRVSLRQYLQSQIPSVGK